MPRVPDASSVTRLRAIQSATVPDPVKRTTSFVPAQTSLLFSLRSTTQGQGLFPGRSVLAPSIVRGFVNPRHQSWAGPFSNNSIPRITIDGGGFDFVSIVTKPVFTYEFPLTEGVIPASTFEVVLTNFTNLSWLKKIILADVASPTREILGAVTISLTSNWPYSVFTSDVTNPTLTSPADEVFPTDCVIIVRNVPTEFGINFVLEGLEPPGEA